MAIAKNIAVGPEGIRAASPLIFVAFFDPDDHPNHEKSADYYGKDRNSRCRPWDIVGLDDHGHGGQGGEGAQYPSNMAPAINPGPLMGIIADFGPH